MAYSVCRGVGNFDLFGGVGGTSRHEFQPSSPAIHSCQFLFIITLCFLYSPHRSPAWFYIKAWYFNHFSSQGIDQRPKQYITMKQSDQFSPPVLHIIIEIVSVSQYFALFFFSTYATRLHYSFVAVLLSILPCLWIALLGNLWKPIQFTGLFPPPTLLWFFPSISFNEIIHLEVLFLPNLWKGNSMTYFEQMPNSTGIANSVGTEKT